MYGHQFLISASISPPPFLLLALLCLCLLLHPTSPNPHPSSAGFSSSSTTQTTHRHPHGETTQRTNSGHLLLLKLKAEMGENLGHKWEKGKWGAGILGRRCVRDLGEKGGVGVRRGGCWAVGTISPAHRGQENGTD
ncbi:hypothetical protein Adt_43653 [Abeliophyllum distichum]|uniref:Uncharacterized protein n=1 Tax=Abeliophyllum distichum TaxID=126358 RepID=A0ABD1P8M5_9LAMI